MIEWKFQCDQGFVCLAVKNIFGYASPVAKEGRGGGHLRHKLPFLEGYELPLTTQSGYGAGWGRVWKFSTSSHSSS